MISYIYHIYLHIYEQREIIEDITKIVTIYTSDKCVIFFLLCVSNFFHKKHRGKTGPPGRESCLELLFALSIQVPYM